MKYTKTCPNKTCTYYSKYIRGNIILFGVQKNGKQRYKCTSCSKTFTDADSFEFYNHFTKEEIKEICLLIASKMSYRQIAKIKKRHLDTIRSFSKKLMKNSRKLKKYLIQEVQMSKAEIKKLRQNLQERSKDNQKPLKTE